ncbi:MAG TPA: helix-turn-helix domain-containing protein, partial [Dehalococcoidia bacterium]|nr:helix-turn-helix domain-containing protein [Dehalococcoidia bacterium]
MESRAVALFRVPGGADISHRNMRTENRQAQRSRTARDHIVRAALGVFALKGYVAASMDDICLAAGCSKGGLYHHFPNKGQVLSSVVKLLIEVDGILPPLDRAAAATGVPAASLGRVLIEVWAEAARDDALRAQLRGG